MRCRSSGFFALHHAVASTALVAAAAACCCLPLGQAETSATASQTNLPLRAGSLRTPNPQDMAYNVAPSFGTSVSSNKIVSAQPFESVGKDTVEKYIDIDATPDECFRIASGFEDYDKWAGVHNVEVLGRGGKGGHGLANLVSMQVGMFGHHLTYVLEYENDRPRSMKWHAVSGSIKALVGSYSFTPIGPGKTRVTYRLSVDPGFYLPHAIRMATSRMVVGCALKELKRFTELPSTKARLQQSGDSKHFFNVPRTLSAEAETMTNPQIWKLTPLL